jgi:protein required for attachment to host cells
MEDIDVNKAEALRQGTTNIHSTRRNDQDNEHSEHSSSDGPTSTSIDGKAHEEKENRIKPTLHHYNSRYDRPYDPLFIFQDISSIGKGRYPVA